LKIGDWLGVTELAASQGFATTRYREVVLKSFARYSEAYRTPEILLTTFSVASYY
jgi:hypothetical protein